MMKAVKEWDDDAGTEILLIASDSDVAEMYRMKLELDGYRVTRTDDPRDRMPFRAGWKPDLVMFDLGDASKARLVELERLRAHPVLGDIPLLVLAADSEQELRRRGLTLGPKDYVLKVAHAEALAESVEHWSAVSLASAPPYSL
jgi:two-component system, OmpR family, response regulator RpaA